MKRLTLTVAMLALGATVCSPKANAASLVNEIPVKAESTFQLAKINTNSTVLATSEWKQFSSAEGKFSIMMPDVQIVDKTEDKPEFLLKMYVATNEQSAFIAGYEEFHVDVSQLSDRTFLDAFVEAFLGGDKKLVSQQEISLGEFTGREIEYQEQGYTAKIRLYRVGQRLYILGAINPQAGDTEKFFDSFTLEAFSGN